MATYKEIVYMVLDLLKESTDDSFYTEEHVLFLSTKIRALLLERKYQGSRNQTNKTISDENRQQICMMLEPTKLLPTGCGGQWLRSVSEIPSLMSIDTGVTCTGHDMLQSMVTFIPEERMPYVGYNKWLKNIIYAAKSQDGHLYLTSVNPQFVHLKRVGLTGVFADPEAAAKMSHKACENGGICDIMSEEFPLEAALIPSCIELIAQELSGSRYAPEDNKNNAQDDFGTLTNNGGRTSTAAESSGARDLRAE